MFGSFGGCFVALQSAPERHRESELVTLQACAFLAGDRRFVRYSALQDDALVADDAQPSFKAARDAEKNSTILRKAG